MLTQLAILYAKTLATVCGCSNEVNNEALDASLPRSSGTSVGIKCEALSRAHFPHSAFSHCCKSHIVVSACRPNPLVVCVPRFVDRNKLTGTIPASLSALLRLQNLSARPLKNANALPTFLPHRLGAPCVLARGRGASKRAFEAFALCASMQPR
jgi:hypothetical protein